MSRKASHPPDRYLDGCTMAPDHLGWVYHGDICIDHDRDYWHHRTFTSKWVADARWAGRIIARHWRTNSWPWKVAALAFAVTGWAALSTAGWWFWIRRHRFDG